MSDLNLTESYKLGGSAALVALTIAAGFWLNSKKGDNRLGPSGSSSLRPPGPKPAPIIKNLLQIPRSNTNEAFDAFREQYGASIRAYKLRHMACIMNWTSSMIMWEVLTPFVGWFI
jgi:hypothetical protein